MNDTLSDEFQAVDTTKLPTGLNVLTILTIIGSLLFNFIMGFYGYISAQKNYDKTKELIDSGKLNDSPEFVKKMMTPEMLEVQHKMLENRLPILIITLVAGALCLYGALEMRKRKKQGYFIYVIGEILPFIATVIFVGGMAFQGFGLIGVFLPLLFIILYTIYRKELIYK